MKAGPRKYLVTVQRYTTSELPSGEQAKDWADFTILYAAVSFGTGKERRQAAQETASAPATLNVLRTPKAATITPADRLVFDGSEWEIVSAVPSKVFGEGVDITAVRRTA